MGRGRQKVSLPSVFLPFSKTRFFIIFFSWNQPKRGQWGPKQPGSGWGQPPQRPDQNIWPPQPSWVRSYFFNSIVISFRMPLADIPTRIQVSIIISIKTCNMWVPTASYYGAKSAFSLIFDLFWPTKPIFTLFHSCLKQYKWTSSLDKC